MLDDDSDAERAGVRALPLIFDDGALALLVAMQQLFELQCSKLLIPMSRWSKTKGEQEADFRLQ